MPAEPHLRDTLKSQIATLQCNRCGRSVTAFESGDPVQALEAAYGQLLEHLDQIHEGWRDADTSV